MAARKSLRTARASGGQPESESAATGEAYTGPIPPGHTAASYARVRAGTATGGTPPGPTGESHAAPEAAGIRPETGQAPVDNSTDGEIRVNDRTTDPTTDRRGPRKARAAAPETEAVNPFANDPRLSSAILSMVEMLTVPAVGEHARFTQSERLSIEPPLGRILAKMSPSKAAAITAVSDPLMLGVGLLIWSMRVFKTQPGGSAQWQNSPTGQQPTPIRRETRSNGQPPAQPSQPSAQVTAVYPETPPQSSATHQTTPTSVPGVPEADLISAWETASL